MQRFCFGALVTESLKIWEPLDKIARILSLSGLLGYKPTLIESELRSQKKLLKRICSVHTSQVFPTAVFTALNRKQKKNLNGSRIFYCSVDRGSDRSQPYVR